MREDKIEIQKDQIEPEEKIEEEEKETEEPGCLSLFLMPLFLSIMAIILLITTGFVINLLIHFESNQLKVIWIASSLLAGIAIYFLVSRAKKKRES